MTRAAIDALADAIADRVDTLAARGIAGAKVSVRMLRQWLPVAQRPTWGQVPAMVAELLEVYPELRERIHDDAGLAEHDERRRTDACPDGAGMDWQEIQNRRAFA